MEATQLEYARLLSVQIEKRDDYAGYLCCVRKSREGMELELMGRL
jgi:hypothetical protein